MSGGSRLGARLAALGISAALSLAVAEVGARILAADEGFYDVEMWRYAQEAKMAVPDGRVFAHRPSVRTSLYGVPVAINAQGFRDDALVEVRPDEKRVLLLGDSLTMGWGVPVDAIFAARLPALLADQGSVRVINTGVGAYGTVQEVAAAEVVGLPLRPSAIVLAWFINDAEPVPGFHPAAGWEHSRFGLFLRSRGERLRRTADPTQAWEAFYRNLYADDAPGWMAAKFAFARLGELSRAHGVPATVVLLPELHRLGEAYPFADVHTRVASAAADSGLSVVDAVGAFPAGDGRPFWVSDEDAHPNAEGHRLIAGVMADAVRSMLVQGESE